MIQLGEWVWLNGLGAGSKLELPEIWTHRHGRRQSTQGSHSLSKGLVMELVGGRMAAIHLQVSLFVS